jgi:hypothetical protein
MPIVDRSIDSLTGLVTDIGFEDGQMKVRYQQDASGLHAQNQKLREADGYAREGMRKGFMHGVSLSVADCLKLWKEDGLNPWTASAAEINRHIFRNREKWGHAIVTSARVGAKGR